MGNNKIIKILQELGLNEKESKVYLSCLSLGPSSILNISKKSKIKRTTVYSIIEELKNKGLIFITIDVFKKKYEAQNPNKLMLLLEEKREKLNNILPFLENIYKSENSNTKIYYYENIKNIKNLYLDLLKEVKNGDDYFVITNQKIWLKQDVKFFKNFIEKRSKLNLNLKILMQNSEISKKYKKFEKNYNQQVKILPEKIFLENNIVITNHKIIIHTLNSKNSAIIIKDKSIINTQKELFNLIWKLIK